jgi:uncharacterized membrane protein YczE
VTDEESTTLVTAPPAFLRRLVQLLVGLVGFGISLALMVRAELGLGPWDVLHQGMAERMGLEIGTVVIAMSAVVLVLWIPLRQRPGLGTLANVAVVGLAVNATLTMLPAPDHLTARLGLLAAGVVCNGAATGMYIGAGLGPGPRDGLMTGLAQRGLSIRLARTLIELSVLAIGWGLGGLVGIGTVVYAISIGPLAHYFIPKFTLGPSARSSSPPSSDPTVSPREVEWNGCCSA